MPEEPMIEGRSLSETPTWAVATVITIMVAVGFLVHGSLKHTGRWLIKTKRKALLAALDKIREELMLFGLLSLLMSHWTIWVAKICIKTSRLGSRFYPCSEQSYITEAILAKYALVDKFHYLNNSAHQEPVKTRRHDYCPEGYESFVSCESLEQLHRFLFVLGITHVSYSFITIALAMLKIYSWRKWENQAKSIAIQGLQGSLGAAVESKGIRRLSTFIFHHTSHPWSHHKVLIWLLCFSRQFWSSINRADYMALRLGFITNHELHLTYDFHNYMIRSMEEEFRDILGISIPLWAYAILCIFLNFHGTNAYFWLSFLPAILILLVGTKLHHVVVKLALEILDTNPYEGKQFNLRDELFWFGKPKFLSWLMQLISFQNAFEMATFIWSLWEIRGPSCFMENRVFLVIRLICGVIFQFWCSYITLPLVIIVTEMGSRFKKSLVSENIRKSLHGWHRRVKKSRQDGTPASLAIVTSNSSSDSMMNQMDEISNITSSIIRGDPSSCDTGSSSRLAWDQVYEQSSNENFQVPLYDSYDDSDDQEDDDNGEKDVSCLLSPPEDF